MTMYNQLGIMEDCIEIFVGALLSMMCNWCYTTVGIDSGYFVLTIAVKSYELPQSSDIPVGDVRVAVSSLD